MLLGSTSLAAPAAATSRALAPQGPAPDCPSIAEVNATPFAERWAVWDAVTPNACRFFEEHGECGADMPCNPKERTPTAACCTPNGCSGVYRLPPLAIPAEFRVARGDGSMMETLLANRSAALLAASDEYL